MLADFETDRYNGSEAVAIEGHYAYIAANYAGLLIYDIADPANPQLAGTFNAEARVHDVEVRNGWAFLATGANNSPDSEYGLFAVDVTDPTNPQGRLVPLPGIPRSFSRVELAGNLALAYPSLQVFDISDPAHTAAIELDSYPLVPSPEDIKSMRAVGDTLLIAQRSWSSDHATVYQIDLSNPTAPALVDTLEIPDGPIGMDYDADRLWVASATTLDVYDFTNERIGDKLHTYDVQGSALRYEANRLYLATPDRELEIFDATDPLALTTLGTYPIWASVPDFEVSGGLAFIPENLGYDQGGLTIIDVSDPVPGSMHITNFDVDSDRAVSDGTLVYGVAGRAFFIGDPSIPESAERLTWVSLDNFAQDLKIAPGTAFVASGGLSTIDITDPTDPIKLAYLPVNTTATAIELADDLAFVAGARQSTSHYTFWSFDVSAPASPTLLDAITLSADAKALALKHTIAYVASRNGLHIVDVSNPHEMVELATYSDVAGINDLCIVGDTCYAVTRADELVMLDLSNPTDPVYVDTLVLPGLVSDAYADGNRLYVRHRMWFRDQILIYDISTPGLPIPLGAYTTYTTEAPYGTPKLTVRDDVALLPWGSTLQVLDLSDCPPCPADLDANGVLNFDDLDAFVAAFLAADPLADLDASGTVSFDDLDLFIASYLAGCP